MDSTTARPSPKSSGAQARERVGADARSARALRLLEILLAVAALIAALPLLVVLSVLVRIDTGRPALRWQQHEGPQGKPYRSWYFVTLRAAHDEAGRRLTDRQRRSAFGALLVWTQLERLPQIINVLAGDVPVLTTSGRLATKALRVR